MTPPPQVSPFVRALRRELIHTFDDRSPALYQSLQDFYAGDNKDNGFSVDFVDHNLAIMREQTQLDYASFDALDAYLRGPSSAEENDRGDSFHLSDTVRAMLTGDSY